jgi:hypothetical protein
MIRYIYYMLILTMLTIGLANPLYGVATDTFIEKDSRSVYTANDNYLLADRVFYREISTIYETKAVGRSARATPLLTSERFHRVTYALDADIPSARRNIITFIEYKNSMIDSIRGKPFIERRSDITPQPIRTPITAVKR